MVVNIRGGNDRQKELVESIAHYAATLLMTDRLADTLEINIQLKRNLAAADGCYGDCIWEDSNRRPKEFNIRADSSLRLRRLLETIAHEMVHAKQWARGELEDFMTRPGESRFLGKLYTSKSSYWDQPWEIEAHGRELGIFIRWAEAHGHAKRAWSQEVA